MPCPLCASPCAFGIEFSPGRTVVSDSSSSRGTPGRPGVPESERFLKQRGAEGWHKGLAWYAHVACFEEPSGSSGQKASFSGLMASKRPREKTKRP